MEHLFKSIKRLERRKKEEYVFTNNGVAKQAKFLTTVKDWVHDELEVKLEAEFGQLSKSLKDVITAGEKLLSDRFHLLKIADRYGWEAVTEFTEIELARNEVEEKKLRKIMKTSELKRAKAREIKSREGRRPYFQATGGYRAVSPNNMYDSCVVKAAHGEGESLEDFFSVADISDKAYEDDDGEPPWHINENDDMTSDEE